MKNLRNIKKYKTILFENELYTFKKVVSHKENRFVATNNEYGFEVDLCLPRDEKDIEIIAEVDLITLAMNTLFQTNNGKFFSVSFIKKDGTLRKATCRRGVYQTAPKSKNKKTTTYNPLLDGYLTVYDVNKKSYIKINLKTIKEAKIKGIKYKVK